ncbi:transposable element Tcb1 transposase [Trichonephila clavipes]|nr:transposable element Tcb1 transposase [Trichonephila clavipes]
MVEFELRSTVGGIGFHCRIPLVRIAGTLNSQRYISEMESLPWSACSLDLLPMKNVRSMLAQRLAWDTPPSATPDKLWQYVEAALSLLYPKDTSKVSLIQCRGVWRRRL